MPTPAPTPTPTPAPPPTGANTSLLAPLKSETFAGDAIGGYFSLTGSLDGNRVSDENVTVVYHAGSKTYVIYALGHEQSFRPQDRDAALSTALSDRYIRIQGDVSDSLYLTRASDEQATAANPRFRYVGGGIWQRTIAESGFYRGWFDAFAYGVETPNTAVPQIGSAQFDVMLHGIVAKPSITGPVTGKGALTIDFATGAIIGSGTLGTNLTSEPFSARRWATTAQLRSLTNTFYGEFGMGPTNAPSGPIAMTGGIDGRLYGPAAQELGAAWYWRDDVNGESYGGYMLGIDEATYPYNASLRALMIDEDFIDEGWVYRNYIDSDTGIDYYDGEPNPHTGTGTSPAVRYSEELDALVLLGGGALGEQLIDPADRNAGLSTSTYDVYTFTQAAPNGNPETWAIKVFRPADDNPVVALTYTSFVNWEYSNLAHAPYYNVNHGWVAFGQETPASAIPVIGTARYAASIFGQSDIATAANGSERFYTITGTGQFDFDFAAGTLAGWLHPLLRDPTTSSSYDLGQYAFSDTHYATGSQTFYGSFPMYPEYLYGTHLFEGQFTGPHAEELFARWQTQMTDPVTSQQIDIFGVAVGKQVTPP